MTGIPGGGTGNIGQLVNQGLSEITNRNDDIQSKMSAIMNKEGGATSEDMLTMQFEMGQYNAMIESLSNVTKSMTDTLKSLAQKTG